MGTLDPDEADDDENEDEDNDTDDVNDPISSIQLLSVDDAPSGISIKDSGAGVASYPISFSAELAYMVTAGNPFAAYSKEYDFDLSDNEVFSINETKASD